MGRSRSRDKEKDRDRRRDKDKEKDKDKDRKRSRSRRRERSREKDKKEKKEKKDRERERERDDPPPPPKQPERPRSPSIQYNRRWRFDSPPKEEDYQRDAVLTSNPAGLAGGIAAVQGGAGLQSALAIAQDTKAMRELYVGNLPAGVSGAQLVQFLNQVALAVKVNSLPGEPVLGATMGGGGLFAFVEFRTAEEAGNGLRLNGVELLGCQLKIGRPKGYTGPEAGPGAQLAIGGPGSGPLLGDMMAQNGALKPGFPGMGHRTAAVSAIDHRLCLCNIPTFVADDRIKELLMTFGQIKFFAMQKDEQGKSVGVAFFEYQDMMTQQQARAALEGLELGSKKLMVKRPEEALELGLVDKVQKIGQRVVPSRVIYLKNIVSVDDLTDETTYQEICADIRLEGEKFGPVVSMEIPRPKVFAPGGVPDNALMGGPAGGGALALTDTPADNSGFTAVAPGALVPVAQAAPQAVPDLSMALVPAGSIKAPIVQAGSALQAYGDSDAPGVGYAFLEFATIEGSSKAKKSMHGRRFGSNTVEAEYFSEDRYQLKDFSKPTPNTDEPRPDPLKMELALIGGPGLEEAPVMAD